MGRVESGRPIGSPLKQIICTTTINLKWLVLLLLLSSLLMPRHFFLSFFDAFATKLHISKCGYYCVQQLIVLLNFTFLSITITIVRTHIVILLCYFFLSRLFSRNWLTINRRYSNRISSSGGIDSTLHVKLYTSSEPLNVGEMNSAGPGRPEISMYFFVRPSALSATQLLFFVPR